MFSRSKLRGLSLSIAPICVCAASVQGVLAQTAQARAVRPVSVVGDLIDIARANDERDNTRASAGTSNYVGLSVTLDLGGEQNIIGVIQDHGRWPNDYPGSYRVEIAESSRGRNWVTAFEGPGQRGESKATFEAVRGRFIRITATDRRGGDDDWAIAELRAVIDPGATPRRFPGGERDRDNFPDVRGDRGMRDVSQAFDRNLNTRATSGAADYSGATFTFDLGGEYELSRVVQLHGQWPDDYPNEYRIEVSRDRNESRFREVWRGTGEPGRSVAAFAPVFTRYVRITAIRNRDRYHWWSIAEVRTNRDQDVVERDEDDELVGRQIRRVTAQGISDAAAVSDDNNTTRATTGTVSYAGSWIMADLGGSYTVSRVIQVHNPDERDFPGRYRIEVSEDGRNWRTVWQGQGERGRSAASFSPVRARFVRITAISNHDLQHWWSIHKLRIRG